MFVFSFKNGNDNPTRNFFDKYFMLFGEIKGFNASIDNKPVFDQPGKNQTRSVWKAYLNIKKWWQNNRKIIRFFISSKLL